MTEILRELFGNVVVQVLVGIGIMTLLMGFGRALRDGARGRDKRAEKELEMKLLSESQAQLAKMRSEMDQLKTTLVEHSMSLDRNFELLSSRVKSLETRQPTTREQI